MNNLQPIRSLLARLDRALKDADLIRGKDGTIKGYVLNNRDVSKLAESMADLSTVEALRW
jgi:hypothetical protein